MAIMVLRKNLSACLLTEYAIFFSQILDCRLTFRQCRFLLSAWQISGESADIDIYAKDLEFSAENAERLNGL